MAKLQLASPIDNTIVAGICNLVPASADFPAILKTDLSATKDAVWILNLTGRCARTIGPQFILMKGD
ncbi:MAG: hypothetical protein ABSG74_02665 [Candidatus Bathyarchaeia archaeon]